MYAINKEYQDYQLEALTVISENTCTLHVKFHFIF